MDLVSISTWNTQAQAEQKYGGHTPPESFSDASQTWLLEDESHGPNIKHPMSHDPIHFYGPNDVEIPKKKTMVSYVGGVFYMNGGRDYLILFDCWT